MARRTKEEAEETRRRILSAALDLFSEKGYSRTTFVDVAERIGMTKGAVYWHFRDKPALLAALIREMAARQETLIAEEVPSIESLRELRAYFVARTRVATEDAACRKFVMFIALQMEWSLETIAAIHREMDEHRSVPFEDVEKALAGLAAAGCLAAGVDVKVTKEILLGLWFGLLNTHMQGLGPEDVVERVGMAVDMVIAGIAKKGVVQ